MFKCEVCGNLADKHHIVYKSQGGIEFPLNFRYLCSEHHRGNSGPHKNRRLDLEYKLEMQKKLQNILINRYYTAEELEFLLGINKGMIKRLFKDYKQSDKEFKAVDIIFRLMGRKSYDESMLLEGVPVEVSHLKEFE